MRSEATPETDLSGSQSVDRALRLLSLVGRETSLGLSLSETVEESGLNKPTARRLLLALMRAGLVEQDARTRRYHLGAEAFVLGVLSSPRHGVLELAMESMRQLSDATMDTSFLTVRRDRFALCLHREEGSFPVRTHALQTGDQHPLGVGAGSLAILAALSTEEAQGVIDSNGAILAARYPGYSPTLLHEDIAETQRRGWALNPGRIVDNSWGIGVPIRFPDGSVAGALSIAAIDSRMRPDRQVELAAGLHREADAVERKLRAMATPRLRAPPETARPSGS